MTCYCRIYESAKGRYYIILGRYILTELRLNLKFSNYIIEVDDGTFKGSTAPMFDMGTYEFTDFGTGKITPEVSLMNSYAEEVYESEHFRTYTKLSCVILYGKYEKADSNEVMKNKCQHMIETKRNELLKLLQNI